MSTYKTKINSAVIDGFIGEHFGPGVSDVALIADGEVSQACIVTTPTNTKVVRFNRHTDEGYRKDRFAYEHFRSPKVLIPEIEEIGTLPDGMFFSVSTFVPGVTLDKLPTEELLATMPAMIVTMEAIHETSPVGTGFGAIQLDGNGNAQSWHEALDQSQVSNDDDQLDSIAMFERDLYEQFRARIREKYRFCPNDIRQLIHRDFGFNNTLALDGKITGVIDWDDMAYGDPLYDVAWQDFWKAGFSWGKDIDILSAAQQHYSQHGGVPESFQERIDCYKMIIGTNCLSFYAKSNQRHKYDFVRGELLKIEPGIGKQ